MHLIVSLKSKTIITPTNSNKTLVLLDSIISYFMRLRLIYVIIQTRKRRNVTSPTANAQQKAGEGFITESQQMTTDSTERSSSQRD